MVGAGGRAAQQQYRHNVSRSNPVDAHFYSRDRETAEKASELAPMQHPNGGEEEEEERDRERKRKTRLVCPRMGC